ncbi:unnamed protein product [Trichogramma brassicae]|uniref:Uncharacterized protein n=1 Tax=Trichogramma brassicae TaxID=86971 RepID=A0A6H5J6V3_9HYME|nr:unnamed protein product [Trichogramma brassicae]
MVGPRRRRGQCEDAHRLGSIAKFSSGHGNRYRFYTFKPQSSKNIIIFFIAVVSLHIKHKSASFSRLLRGHTLLASPPELDIFFRTRCLVPSCECGSRFCRRWQVPQLLCRLHLVSVVLASGATL